MATLVYSSVMTFCPAVFVRTGNRGWSQMAWDVSRFCGHFLTDLRCSYPDTFHFLPSFRWFSWHLGDVAGIDGGIRCCLIGRRDLTQAMFEFRDAYDDPYHHYKDPLRGKFKCMLDAQPFASLAVKISRTYLEILKPFIELNLDETCTNPYQPAKYKTDLSAFWGLREDWKQMKTRKASEHP